MNYHHIPQDLTQQVPRQEFQLQQEQGQEQLQEQATPLNFIGQLQEPPATLSPSQTPTGVASPWVATTPLNESQFNEGLFQMPLLLEHQQNLFQHQEAQSQLITPSGFISPMQPPIATLSPEQMYAQSPLSASTSAPSPAQSLYEPPPMIRIPERRRSTRQQDNSKPQSQQVQVTHKQAQPSVNVSSSRQGVRLSKKPVSVGSGLQTNRTTTRPSLPPFAHTSSERNSNVFSSPLGRKQASEASSSKMQVRMHPYAHARRVVSGPMPTTVNNSVSDSIVSDSPVSASVHSPAHSLPHFSPASEASHDTFIPPPASAPASVPGPAAIPQVNNINKYLCRTDLYVDLQTNVVTASLEVPGISLKNIRISLSKSPQTKQTLLLVQGRNFTLLPDGTPVDQERANILKEEGRGLFLWCERKCGDFRRTLTIPSNIKKEQIKLQLLNGILFISYPADSNVVNVARAQHNDHTRTQQQPQIHSEMTMRDPQAHAGPERTALVGKAA